MTCSKDRRSLSGAIPSMESTWIRLFLFNYVCLLLVHYVYGKRAELSQLSVGANCSALEPPPCILTHSTDNATGAYDYAYYLETCPHHQCTLVSPVNYPLARVSKKQFTSNKTTPAADLQEAFKPPNFRDRKRKKGPYKHDVPYSTIDEKGALIRPNKYWFCQSKQVGYTARVETGTGLPAGEKEDQWAQCQWNRANSLVGLGTDYMIERHGGPECTYAYQIYICAMAFPKCQPAQGGLPSNGNDIYGPDTLSLLQQKSLMYTITKPCRTICFQMLRMCDSPIDIQCHRYESRDWADYPYCNVAGDVNNGQLFV